MLKCYARYEQSTDTIRHVPTNVCLVAFRGLCTPIYDIDAANKPVRNTVEWITQSNFTQSKEVIAQEISRVLSKTPKGRRLIWSTLVNKMLG
jgi:hypothetical protein